MRGWDGSRSSDRQMMGRGGRAGSGALPVPATGWDAEPGGHRHGGNNSLDGDRKVTTS